MISCGFERRAYASMVLIAGLHFVCGCSVETTSTSAGPNKNPPKSTEPSSASNTDSTKVPETAAPATPTSHAETEKASETVSAEGSSTVYPICQTFAVEFEKKSKRKVSVGKNGTGGGYKKFVNRQADIWNASRPIDQTEIEELKKKGIEWLELTIAVDGLVVAVNSQNTWCSAMTCAQLKQIWEPDSKVKTWSDLDPAWPKEEIALYGADTDSGTFEYFTEVINGKKKATNTRYTPSSDDNVLVQGISSNKYALGYIPFGYYIENTEKLKAIGVSPTKDASETAAPAIEPTVDTILSGEYAPLARPLFMYANKAAMTGRPEVAEFLKFAVSEEAQPFVEQRGFVRVNDSVRQEMAKKLQDSLAEAAAAKN